MRRMPIVIAALAVLAVALATSFVAVDETEIVVVTQFGRPIRVVETAGLTFKWPDPIQSALRLDRRLQPLDQPLSEFLTSDKKNLVVGSFVVWRIADPKRFIQSVRDRSAAQQRILDLLSSELGTVIGTYPLSAILTTEASQSKLAEIAQRVGQAVAPTALAEFGVKVEDVRIRRLSFPEQNLLAVYSRMRAERERIAKKYRAEGEEEAAKIKTETDRVVRQLLAEAYRDAEVERGRGDAESIRTYAEAFERDPAFYKMTRTLEAYRKLLDKNTTLVLSADSPLFRYLETPPEAR
ncbi:MAG: protease modulator HflC [Deltaproteobacteria bacterium]|nr:protease modulator HflC [Deltaproteobacteria bacterium]